MAKTLVAYFSASEGQVSKAVAEQIAAAVGGDLFAIEPPFPYSAADLDWKDKQSRSTIEMEDKSSRPEISAKVSDMSAYDTVFVGFPIWWYTAPHIIWTFLESYDFTGKTVIPFATSGSSKMEDTHTEEDLKALVPAANWKPGKRITAGEDIAGWVKSVI
jgi:flavodoxin